MKVKFTKEFIENKQINGYDIAIKYYLDYYGFYFTGYFLDIKTIAYSICNKNIEITKNEINKLLKLQYVNIEQQTNKLYKVYPYTTDDYPYILIEKDYLNTIIFSDYSFRYQLLKHYLCILTNRYYDPLKKVSYICNRSVYFFSELESISTKAVSKYNTCLEKLGVLYICRSIDKTVNNIYSLPEDKKYAYDYMNIISTTFETSEANKKRMLTQKYNRLCQGHIYSKKEILEIKAHIEKYNLTAPPNKQKDLSVFDTIKY